MDINQEKHHNQIDAYLRNELSDDEKKVFEESLLTDDELKQEYLVHKELYAQFDSESWFSDTSVLNPKEVTEIEKYFRGKDAQELKHKIGNAKLAYDNQIQNRNKLFNRKWTPLLAIAASIILMVTLYMASSSKESPEELFATYHNWDDMPSLTSRGGDQVFSTGQKLFEEGNYKMSYDFFKKITSDTQQISSSLLIYLGLSSLELDKYQEAESYFNQLINSSSIDQSQGYWYRALLYLKQGKGNKAKLVLEELVVDKENYNYSKAVQLLKKL